MAAIQSVVFTCLLALTSVAFASDLKVGDPAPDFSLSASDGKTYTLSDFKGRQAVVLAWFPRAYTSGCTIECRSLTKQGHLIREYDVSYFMASVDPLADNKGFAEENAADFPLLSDPDKNAARDYGVLNWVGMANRTTFYIDRAGTIVKIDRAVRPESSAEDIAAALGELEVAPR